MSRVVESAAGGLRGRSELPLVAHRWRRRRIVFHTVHDRKQLALIVWLPEGVNNELRCDEGWVHTKLICQHPESLLRCCGGLRFERSFQ
jgi:hypothetical protein